MTKSGSEGSFLHERDASLCSARQKAVAKGLFYVKEMLHSVQHDKKQ